MKTLFSILMAFCSIFMLGQKAENLPLNVSLGIGPNYGILGVKTIFGNDHTGLLIGTGVLNGKVAFNAGVQVSYKSMYLSAAYGDYSFFENAQYSYLVQGWSFNLGVNRDLSETKPLFMTFGIGLTLPALNKPWGFTEENEFNVAAGIGYRFGIKRKSSKKTPEFIEV